jgi:PncC family amidohydrolase
MKFEKILLNAKKADEQETKEYYTKLVGELTEKGLTAATAESCTGGLMGKLFTDVSGASAVFSGGMITYTNHIKINKLGVSAETIEKHTEVSFECAAEMAKRAREYFDTDIGISATGFAGPTGGNENDPVGTVYLGISSKAKTAVYRLSFGSCSRDEIRYGTALAAAKAIIYEKTTFF